MPPLPSQKKKVKPVSYAAAFPLVRVPRAATLRRYGLSEAEWLAILERQGGLCALCRRLPESGMLNTDHDHVPKWKKLPATERKLHVRGLLCPFCNHYIAGRYLSLDRATKLLAYLKDHVKRLKSCR